MKARFLFVFLFLSVTLLAVAGDGVGEATAGALQGSTMPAEEALQAVAHGRLVPSGSRPDGVVAAEGPASRIRIPREAGTPADLSGEIAFASDRSGAVYNVYTQSAGGGAAQLFVSSTGHDATPSWSPDGSRLVYASDRSGNFEIYVRPAGGVETKVTNNAFEDIHPSWSPDGRRILFASNRNGGYFQSFTMDVNGQNVEQVSVVPGNHTLWPRYSPDGDRIVFMRASIAIPACDWNWDIWTMDAAGHNQVRVTTQLGGDLYPGWTPDGRIIYASCRNFIDSDLFIVDPNTGAEVRLTNWLFSDEWHATYAPGASHLAFNTTVDGNSEVYIAPAAGGTAVNFTQSVAEDVAPSWTAQTQGPCVGVDMSLQPILLAPGWEAKDTIEADTAGFKQMLPSLESMGYRLECNLFYAGDTAANLTLYENGEVIRQALCDAYRRVKSRNPLWNGRFDIIGHSFGGLRSRAFLENQEAYDHAGRNGARCEPGHLQVGEKLLVDNLFTLGSPHGGGTPDLPGALFIGLSHLRHPDEWHSIKELLFDMPAYNKAHSQPPRVCYRLVGGDAWEQPLTVATLGWLYSPLQQLVANDLGVYRWSAHSLALFWSDQYSQVVPLGTPDMHGYFGLLSLIQSYVYPTNTFDGVIKNRLGADMATCAADQANARVASETEPTPPPVPALLLEEGEVADGSAATRSFELLEAGTVTIYLQWPAGEMTLTLVDPDGNFIDPVTVQSVPNADYQEMTAMSQVAAYVFREAPGGDWSYTVTATGVPDDVPYRLMALFSEPIAIQAEASDWQKAGEPVTISGALTYAEATPLTNAAVEALIGRPDGTTDTLTLFDDGAHTDRTAGDGLYGNRYTGADTGGYYVARVRASGSYQGQVYARTAEAFFTVAPGTAALGGQYSDQPRDDDNDGYYDWLDVGTSVAINDSGSYLLAADLVAADGSYVAHATTRVALAAGTRPVTLSFGGEDIARSGQDGPYTLSSVMLIDIENGTLVLDRAEDAYVTAAYDHSRFGRPPAVYLPVVLR